jgi:hypothetical protein
MFQNKEFLGSSRKNAALFLSAFPRGVSIGLFYP